MRCMWRQWLFFVTSVWHQLLFFIYFLCFIWTLGLSRLLPFQTFFIHFFSCFFLHINPEQEVQRLITNPWVGSLIPLSLCPPVHLDRCSWTDNTSSGQICAAVCVKDMLCAFTLVCSEQFMLVLTVHTEINVLWQDDLSRILITFFNQQWLVSIIHGSLCFNYAAVLAHLYFLLVNG